MSDVTRTAADMDYVSETDWYTLEVDGDGYYQITLQPTAPETAPMVDVEGTDAVGVTFGAMFFDTWSDLDDFSFDVRNAMNQIQQLEDIMRDDAVERRGTWRDRA